MVKQTRIVIIGSGNVATHMALALDHTADVCCVFSPTPGHASRLSEKLKAASATNDVSSIPDDADLYIVAVKDDAIADVARSIEITNGIWAHTSGSVPAEVFEGIKPKYGVFYPLQTFNLTTEVDFSKVPMLVEGNSPVTTADLIKVAQTISDRVSEADSATRGKFHLAAVFACNFVNYMWLIADSILKQDSFDLSYLEPLLKMTLANALQSSPEKTQTGPARRGDMHIIEKHRSMLPTEDAEIYDLISRQIMNHFKK